MYNLNTFTVSILYAGEYVVNMSRSIEYYTLKECFPELVSLVHQSVGLIGDHLFAEGVLSQEDLEYLQSTTQSSKRKARKIVFTLLEKVSHHTCHYETFVRVLKSEGIHTKDVVKQLESTYQKKQQDGTSITQHSTTSATFSEPFISSSTLDPYTDKPRTSNIYDYAESEPSLTLKEQQNKSEEDLRYETEAIIFEFAGLVMKLVECLERCQVSVERLVFYLSQTVAIEPIFIQNEQSGSLISDKCLDEAAQECMTIMQVFKKIKSYYSWFNHMLIDNIFTIFCSEDHEFKVAHQDYKKKFESYCNNRLCCVPEGSDIFGDHQSESQSQTIVLKLDHKWSTIKISQISVIKDSICKLFHIRSEALFLRSARKGCVELLFTVPDIVAQIILPVTPKKEEALHKVGILNLHSITCMYVSLHCKMHCRVQFINCLFPYHSSRVNCTHKHHGYSRDINHQRRKKRHSHNFCRKKSTNDHLRQRYKHFDC